MNKVLQTTLGELIFDKKELIFAQSHMKVEEVAEIMKKKDILSVPVWDEDKRQYIGLVDMFEIMRFAIAGITEEQVFRDDLFTKFQWSEETVGELVSKSSRAQRICVFNTTDPLQAALHLFSESDHRGLVRIPKDETTFQSSYRVVSQMDIIRYLFKNWGMSYCLYPNEVI